jgi:hypothetical protein
MPQGNELAHVTTLQLYLQQLDDCERAGVLIERAPGIKTLAIEFEHRLGSFKKSGRPSAYGPFRWEREIARDIALKLFQSVNSATPRAGLESLRIKSLPLNELLLILPGKLPLRNLKHLHLNRCRQVGPFIRMMTQLGVDLVSYHVDFQSEAQGIRELNEALLHQMTSPKRMHISSMGDMLCDWAVVTAHASNLLSFSIDDGNFDDFLDNPTGAPFVPHRSMSGFFGFCSAASSLEQLVISSPSIESERWDDPAGFTSFLVSIYIATYYIQSNMVPGLSQSGAYPQGPSFEHTPSLLARLWARDREHRHAQAGFATRSENGRRQDLPSTCSYLSKVYGSHPGCPRRL